MSGKRVRRPHIGAIFLRALIHDPAFAWLSPFTAILARLESEFHPRYAERVAQDPDVAFAHARALTGPRPVCIVPAQE